MSRYDYTQIVKTVTTLARSATALKAQAADARVWFDRVSTGTDQEAADALAAAVLADTGVSVPPAEALVMVKAMREVTYWAATFAPTYVLDVRGPSALL